MGMTNVFCCIWPFEFGCEEVTIPVDKPNGFPEAPKNVQYPVCCKRVDAMYVETVTYGSLCFIPCPCCPCGKKGISVACPCCHEVFSNRYSFVSCPQCNCSMDISEKYCSNCGKTNERNRSDQ